jgi:hypothetical protein
MDSRNLNGFMDADQFIVKNGIPYYNKTGDSYLETFRAGLSLEDVLEFNSYADFVSDSNTAATQMSDKQVSDKPASHSKHVYDVPDISDTGYTKKQKKNRKSRPNSYYLSLKKFKKINKNVRHAGNDWKLFRIEQEQGESVWFERLDYKYGTISCYNKRYLSWEDAFMHQYRSLDEYYDDEYYEESYEYYESYMEEMRAEEAAEARSDRMIWRNG